MQRFHPCKSRYTTRVGPFAKSQMERLFSYHGEERIYALLPAMTAFASFREK